jgi:hypothetical protein
MIQIPISSVKKRDPKNNNKKKLVFFKGSHPAVLKAVLFLCVPLNLKGCAAQEDQPPPSESEETDQPPSGPASGGTSAQTSADGVRSQVQPSSGSGGGRVPGEVSGTRDGTVASPIVGPKGDKGDPGEKGPQGDPGIRGQSNGLVLFDQNAQEVGMGFMDSSQNAAYVFRDDGSELYVDRQTGTLKAPAFDFMCLYETSDCTGSCYVYDYRWINVVVTHQSRGTYRVPRESAGDLFVGAKSFRSYTSHQGSCEINGIDATHAYLAEIYQGISIPLAAPLYWAKQK